MNFVNSFGVEVISKEELRHRITCNGAQEITISSSSTAEHPTVNRAVVGSNPAWRA